MKKNFIPIITILFLLTICVNQANAYINPGSGSDFFQMIMSVLVSIGAGFKKVWQFLLGFFIKNKNKDDKYE